MSSKVKVYVIPRGGKYYLRIVDPITGKAREESADTDKLAVARRKKRDKIEAIENGDEGSNLNRETWEGFKTYYAENALPALRKTSRVTYLGALHVFDQHIKIKRLSDVTTSRVTAFVSALRSKGRSEATVASKLRHLKAIMRWANRQGLLEVVPTFEMPKRVRGSKVMRGRPITAEEFDRMLKAVPKVVENIAAPSWEFYLRALWLSGLRLSESLRLRWEDAHDAIVPDFSGRYPMLRIPGEAQKSGNDQDWPIPPDFASLLQSVPERDRKGQVFKLLGPDGKRLRGGRWVIGKVVSAIGKSAGVVVDERSKGDKLVKKFASAHDLRRAFGRRWASRVPTALLRDMMRHADISTTMKYYVGQNALATAEVLWSLPCEHSFVSGDNGSDRAVQKTT